MVSTRRQAQRTEESKRDGAETSVTPTADQEPSGHKRPQPLSQKRPYDDRLPTPRAQVEPQACPSPGRLMQIIEQQSRRLQEQEGRLAELENSIRADHPPTPPRSHKEGEGDSASARLLPPFSEGLMDYRLPKGWKIPTNIDHYDGTTDPTEHLDAYFSTMTYHGASEELMCRTFPIYLKKAALRWFNSQPPRSILSWEDLSRKFLAQFTTSKQQPRSSLYLARVKQRKEESLRDFITRFTAESLHVRDLDPKVALHLLVDALQPGPFSISLAKRQPTTMNELLLRDEKYEPGRFPGYSKGRNQPTEERLRNTPFRSERQAGTSWEV